MSSSMARHFTIDSKARWDREENKALQARVEASGVLHATAPQALRRLCSSPTRSGWHVSTRRGGHGASRAVHCHVPCAWCPGLRRAISSQSAWHANAQPRVNAHGGDIQQLVAQAYLEVAQARYGGVHIAPQKLRVACAGRCSSRSRHPT